MNEGRFQVLWAEEAVLDLEEIVSYVAADSPVNSSNLLTRLRDRAASLNNSPMRGRVVPELARFGIRSWRELVVKPCFVIYRLAETYR